MIKLIYDKNKWQEKYKPFENTIQLYITNKCNFRCPYCYVEDYFDDKNDEMSFNYIKKIVETNKKVVRYNIIGGEPLLHSDINKIFELLEKNNKKIVLYTNGYYLDKIKKKYKNFRIRLSVLSLESGLKPLKKIVSKLNDLKDRLDLDTEIIFLLTKENKNLIYNITDYIDTNLPSVKSLAFGMIKDEKHFNDVNDYIISLEEYAEIIQNFILNYCGRLNINIASKNILYTDKYLKINRCRYRNVFVNNKYVKCLYDIANKKFNYFKPELPFKFQDNSLCPLTKSDTCLNIKICLYRINNVNII
jgi:MoaA/NifB/PqqE/SkfB family radical SAM enzyme